MSHAGTDPVVFPSHGQGDRTVTNLDGLVAAIGSLVTVATALVQELRASRTMQPVVRSNPLIRHPTRLEDWKVIHNRS